MSHRTVLLIIVIIFSTEALKPKRALQASHEKSKEEKWVNALLDLTNAFDQIGSLKELVFTIANKYLSGCSTIILYERFNDGFEKLFMTALLQGYPGAFVHGEIRHDFTMSNLNLVRRTDSCVNYILILNDVMRCQDVIGPQTNSKVIIIARSSQWRVYEFLASEVAQKFVNLLVVAKSDTVFSSDQEAPYNLFTHELYIDAIASSKYRVLTAWNKNNFTRTISTLFPKKMSNGFSGHRFLISLAHQPPYVIKRGLSDNDDFIWDGLEVRIVNLLSKLYNFTTDYREAKDFHTLGSADSVTKSISDKKANLGIGGVYITVDAFNVAETSYLHSQDCAGFAALASTALPRYRAIMGPFHWSVWLALIFVYLFAIIPMAFLDKHTLKPLLRNPEEIENMFWYVFGTFTNAFTFVGKDSWTKATKMATRVLIGFYWLFTIIITACYTGSIIAFVTLPVFPAVVDSAEELLDKHFQIGTLSKGGWQHWFANSSDVVTARLLRNMDLVPNVEDGLRNTTKAFFWSYAFLGSKAELSYIIRTNFTTKSKRSLLHITSECFAPFGVGIVYPKYSVYQSILDTGLLRILQSGLVKKMMRDVEWEIMRSATGKLLAVTSATSRLSTMSVDDRALTLDDTQGMFLLLGAGFLMGGASLLSEWLGGCLHLCKFKRRRASTSSIESNPRSYDIPTPRQKLDSIQYHVKPRLDSIGDVEAESATAEDIERTINGLFNFEEYFGEPSEEHNETESIISVDK